MNLTRMRDFHLEDHCYAAYQSYKGKLDLPDQDIYNIVFHSFPRKSSLNNPASTSLPQLSYVNKIFRRRTDAQLHLRFSSRPLW